MGHQELYPKAGSHQLGGFNTHCGYFKAIADLYHSRAVEGAGREIYLL